LALVHLAKVLTVQRITARQTAVLAAVLLRQAKQQTAALVFRRQ
jgi:hypothetical protein